jgi:hypothetical protein
MNGWRRGLSVFSVEGKRDSDVVEINEPFGGAIDPKLKDDTWPTV